MLSGFRPLVQSRPHSPPARSPAIFLEPHVPPQESSGPPRPAGTTLVDRHFEGRLPRAFGEEPGQSGLRRPPLPARAGGGPSGPPPVSENLGTALPQVPRNRPCATPVSMAAWATAAASQISTRESNGLGMMYWRPN